MRSFISLLVFLFCITAMNAQVRLPMIIRDSMILQRNQPIQLWGWSRAHEKIQILFKGKSYKFKADDHGNWKVNLAASEAGGPFTLQFKATNTIQLKDVWVGEVWLCSGQSNMVHQLNIHDVTYAKEIATANNSLIRQFWIPNNTALEGPQQDLSPTSWKAAVGKDIRPFSAVAYFFAKQLYEKYKVPIGIINASVGGTPIEAWMSEQTAINFPELKEKILQNKDSAFIHLQIRNAAMAAASIQRPEDAGLMASPKWYEQNYIEKNWRPINIPGYWEDQGIKDLEGIVWFRSQFYLPTSMHQQAATLFMGRIVDADEIYVNGTKIGSTGYQYPQRRYKIPADILKKGNNLIAIKVTNYAGKGGFVPNKPYCLFAGSDTVDLKGTWQYKVGAVFPKEVNNQPVFNKQNQPAALFNAMVAPYVSFRIKGVCWYQGESNTARPKEYQQWLPALIKDWRTQWNQDTLPFLYVQLPGFMDYNYYPSESNWAELRQAQLDALRVPHSGMVVAIDLGEWNDIHPDNKKTVGDRLATMAQVIGYKDTVESTGPIIQSATLNGNKVTLNFQHVGSGLAIQDGETLQEFAIAGADKKFVWAKAILKNNTVIVWNDAIQRPLYIRYAWADNPVNANLYNKEGLPASPFQIEIQ